VSGIIQMAVLAGLLLCGYYFLVLRKQEEPKPVPPNPLAQGPPPASGPPAVAQPAPSLAPPPATPSGPDQLQNVELTTAASIQRQQLAAAKFKQRQAVAIFDEVTRAIDEWERELAAWEKLGPPLLTSEEGKRIAADTTLVKRFRAYSGEERQAREDIAAARKQAEELISPVREAVANAEDASAPEEKITTALRELQAQARKARDSYRDGRSIVEGLLARASTPGEKTLQQAIAALDQEEALERADFIDAEERKAKDAGAKLIAEAKVKLQQVQAEAEANKLRDQAERKRHGFLHAGSTWKGTRSERSENCPSTLLIATREGDSITGTLTYTYERQQHTAAFEGTVQGNLVTFKLTALLENFGTMGQTYDARLDPTSAGLAGTYGLTGTINGTFGYRYERPAGQ
jgi:hypothetical protein